MATTRVAARQLKEVLVEHFAVGPEDINCAVGTSKIVFRASFAMTLVAIRASLNVAPVGSTFIFDINVNGASILSTKLSIDANEKTSVTAATAAVLSSTSIADDDEISVDFDQVGSTTPGKGPKIKLYYYKT